MHFSQRADGAQDTDGDRRSFVRKKTHVTGDVLCRDVADYREMEVYLAKADAVRARALAATDSPFTIEIRFVGGLTDTQQAAFARAGDRWAHVIVGDLPDIEVDGELIDDVLILAQGQA